MYARSTEQTMDILTMQTQYRFRMQLAHEFANPHTGFEAEPELPTNWRSKRQSDVESTVPCNLGIRWLVPIFLPMCEPSWQRTRLNGVRSRHNRQRGSAIWCEFVVPQPGNLMSCSMVTRSIGNHSIIPRALCEMRLSATTEILPFSN